MNYKESIWISGISFIVGLFALGIIFMPVSFYFAKKAEEMRPQKSMPAILMVLSALMTIFYLFMILVFIVAL